MPPGCLLYDLVCGYYCAHFHRQRLQNMATFLFRLAVAAALIVSLWAAKGTSQETPSISFTAHTIDTGLKGGYQSVIVDLNRDGRLDVIGLAMNIDHLAWYENPGFKA